MKNLILLAFAFSIMACNRAPEGADRQQLIDEIVAVENAFARMAADSGIGPAFVYFAAENAVIQRGKELVTGKDSIRELYLSRKNPNESLVWYPDYVDVSGSGDLAYTYGHYTYRLIQDGDTITDTGIFHTVWKRDSQGNWKFVWD